MGQSKDAVVIESYSCARQVPDLAESEGEKCGCSRRVGGPDEKEKKFLFYHCKESPAYGEGRRGNLQLLVLKK